MRDPTRPLGVVYTPRGVAAAMVELALTPLVAGKSADEVLALRVCDPAIGEGVFLVEAVRVLADALVAAWEREAGVTSRDASANAVGPRLDHGSMDVAARAHGSMDVAARAPSVRAPYGLAALAPSDRAEWGRIARAEIVSRCIVGVDVDAQAVAAARAVLGAGEDVLRVEDATTLEWARAFPDVFACGGFDVVVGNPPYIRQERLGSKAALRGFASYHGVADLYVYFIELAHRVLRPSGRYCLIVPNKWLTVAYARPLRAFLAKEASVDGLVDLSRARLFADADAFPCIVWGTTGAASAQRGPIVAARPDAETPVARALRDAEAITTSYAIATHEATAHEASEATAHVSTMHAPMAARSSAAPSSAAPSSAASSSAASSSAASSSAASSSAASSSAASSSAAPSSVAPSSVAPSSAAQSSAAPSLAASSTIAALHPRAAWGPEPWHIEGASERALLERIEGKWPRLGEVVTGRASRGVVTGLNRAFVIDRETRARLLEREPAAAAMIRPFVKGRDVRPWRVEDAGRWILLVDRGTEIERMPAVRGHLQQFREALEPKPVGWEGTWKGRKPGAYAWYELQDPVGPLVKGRGPRLLFQDIQTAPACALDESGEVAPDTTVWMLPTDDRVLLAILNSPLYGWFAGRRFPPALNGAVRPKLEYMRSLPIAQASPAMRREIEGMVERRLTLATLARSGERDGAIAEMAARGDELDALIVEAIYELYEVTDEERRMIEMR